MTSSTVALLLVLAALVGTVRTWRRGGPRRVMRVTLQLVAAALLYAVLFPPATREQFAAGELVVLTPGTTTEQRAALSPASTLVALPGIDAPGGIERVPDLGTALRSHPDARRLHIVGGGLPARDRDAARGLVARFDAAPLPRGVVELDAPTAVRAGSVWRLAGRVEGVGDGRVELRDPAGAVVAGMALDGDGRFTLSAPAKGAGEALFALRVLDRDGTPVDDVPVPLVTRAGAPLRLLLLAGAPDPELKYLRRWAVDAGVQLDSRLALTEGVALTEGALALDAAALAKADLVLVDERAWAALGTTQKAALTAAVRDGLGLLLRVTGPLPPAIASDWAALGFRVQAQEPANLALDHALGLSGSGFVFARHAIDVQADDAAPLLRADDGAPLALWRAQAQGRIGVWALADAWRLALAGERARYATLWSDTLATLSRARAAATPQLPREARVDERAILCGIATGDRVETAQGTSVAMLIDPITAPGATAAHACAAYWPAKAGWHALVSGGQRWPFHVRADDEAKPLAAAANQQATRALVAAPGERAELATRPMSWPRWPFFLAWLAVIALLWWLERQRVALAPADDTSDAA
ncbi:MAG: carboxypeptidase regulatory-like domain-containing protein [Rhodanobacteraceae bacterium]|jgi:hypothetical protein|nr:carboxypeptidase regulatory-like domain-containing protein [Rhodanobacteraceae bacterium]